MNFDTQYIIMKVIVAPFMKVIVYIESHCIYGMTFMNGTCSSQQILHALFGLLWLD